MHLLHLFVQTFIFYLEIHPYISWSWSNLAGEFSLTKAWVKKMIHLFGFISQKISILSLKVIKKGQYEMFKGLIWGIVLFCRSKIARDMARNLKKRFSSKAIFCKKWRVFFTKSQKSPNRYIHVSGHISGNFWATEAYNISF